MRTRSRGSPIDTLTHSLNPDRRTNLKEQAMGEDKLREYRGKRDFSKKPEA